MKKRMFYAVAVVVLVLGLTLFAAMPASAAAVVSIELDPTPPGYILNNGVEVQGFRWTIEFDSVPDHYTFEVRTFPGGVLVDTTETNFSKDITGQSSPVHNDEWTGYHVWHVPAGVTPGEYRAQVTYYSTTGYEADAGRVFAIRQRVQVYKYNDLNGNGANDAGEPPLSGWDFDVTGPESWTGDSTDATGYLIDSSTGYAYKDFLKSGTYTVTETLNLGWKNTDPGGSAPYDKTFTVPDPAGQTIVVEFGNQGLADLVIFKYHDKNYSKSYDAGDTALAGWEFAVSPTPPAVPGNPTPPYLTGADGKITLKVYADTLYTITETLKSGGWINTDPGTAPYQKQQSVPVGESRQVNFGNKPMAELVIFKYHDKNYSKSYDAGDTALAGWEFTVSPTPPAVPGNPTPPYVTGADGKITLKVNADTLYTITETLKSGGWINTDPGTAPYQKQQSVPMGESRQVNFGNKPMAELVIFKYNDKNSSKSYDAGDTALANWEFTVSPTPPAVPGNPTPPYLTGADGKITLKVNADTLYTITETLKLGWTCTDPGGTAPYQKQQSVPMGESRQVNFGNQGLADLVIFKYHDKNYSKSYDAGDTALAGWEFAVSPTPPAVPGNPTPPYVTGADGKITLKVNADTLYTITETLKSGGWINTDPGTAPYQKQQSVPAGESRQVNLGNKPMAELVIFKYNDKNSSKSYDAGDTALANWEFTVSPTPPAVPGNPTTQPYKTDANGKITLKVNADTLYTITETLKSGWNCTDPGGTAPYQKSQSVLMGESRQVNFGNSAPLTCLTICKFEDANVNGVWDPLEEGLPGWRFHVTGNGYNEWVTTGPEGCVVLEGLTSGEYTVTEELRAGWYNTRPGGDPPYKQEVNVEKGAECARVEFGNREEIKDIPPLVPAMNKWGIIAMIIVFAGLLVWTVRRKRLAS